MLNLLASIRGTRALDARRVGAAVGHGRAFELPGSFGEKAERATPLGVASAPGRALGFGGYETVHDAVAYATVFGAEPVVITYAQNLFGPL